jgi:CHAT domain-containing protein
VPNRPGYEAAYALIEENRRRFSHAETIEQFQEIRDAVLTVARMNAAIEPSNLPFRARLLAAKCAFAASRQANSNEEEHWLVRAFEDALATGDLGKRDLSADCLVEFASLISNLYTRSERTYWTVVTEARVSEWLHRLASTVETSVPIELQDKQGPSRTSELARVLADLSYRHGTRKAADARSDFAITSARNAGALQAWIDALYARYQRVRDLPSLTSRRLHQATSLEDLEALVQELSQSQQDPRTQLSETQESLRNLATALRRRCRSRTARLWAAQYAAPILGDLLEDNFAAGYSAGALLETTENLKARLLLDYLVNPFDELSSTQVRAQATQKERQILEFEPEPPQAAKDLVRHELLLTSQLPIGLPSYFLSDVEADTQRQQLDSLEDLYTDQNAGFVGTTTSYPHTAVAAALEPDEALIEYYVPSRPKDVVEQTVYVFVLTHEAVHVRSVPVRRDPNENWAARMVSVDDRQPIEETVLGDQVIAMRLAIHRGEDETASHYLQNLYEVLISPIIELGLRPHDFRRWIIVPHAMLHSIPFAALQSPSGRFLIEDVALTVTPSASVWYALQSRARAPVTSFVGFADPLLLDAKWPPLPQSGDEVRRICDSLKLLHCTSHLSEEANEANVQTDAPGKSIVHFATHGDFPESDVIDMHQIVLTPTAESDGMLHAEELRRLDLHSTRLVALSICDGGLYRIGPGDEPYGLIPALLTAGAENVIGTLWPVEDRTGRAFMVEFYRDILSQGPAEAFRRACTSFLEQKKPLHDWAGWVLVGLGRPWHGGRNTREED